MNKGNIAHLIAEATHELLAAEPTLASLPARQLTTAITTCLLRKVSHKAVQLGSAIKKDASFGLLRGGWLQNRGRGGIIQDLALPSLLISQAIAGRAPDKLVKQARAFATSRESSVTWYFALAGVATGTRFHLAKNIQLIPWSDVPACAQKRDFELERSSRDWLDESLIRPALRATASAAIRIRFKKAQVLFRSAEAEKVSLERQANEDVAMLDNVRDATRCLNLLSSSAVLDLGNWPVFDDPFASLLGSSGISYSSDIFDQSVALATWHPEAVDSSPVSQLFRLFDKFDRSDKDVMRMALDRLSQSMRKRNDVDRAIDLGIALEMLLLHESERGELKYRFSVHGAMLLGGNKAERMATYKLLQNVYDLRSSAVHRGILKTRSSSGSPHAVLNAATAIGQRIGKKLIRLGAFPDWEADYVVGHGRRAATRG